MYGTVLGASVTTGAIAVLPNTSGSKLSLVVTLACLVAGVVILIVTAARTIAAKIFNA